MDVRNKHIRVFEYEKITLHKDDKGRYLLPAELSKLYDFNDRNGNKFFTGIRDGVKFQNYVGVIQIGGLTIEILPKADQKKITHKEEYDHWHKVLLDMLRICRRIQISSVSEASLKRRYNSILDLYFETYLDELENLIHTGLIKKYRKQSGNLNALKGRIEFSKNIQKNLIHKERFYTHHQVYDYDHLINQILLEGLNVLSIISSNPILKDRISRITSLFPEVKKLKVQPTHFRNLKQTRKTAPYAKAIQIARMILLNYSPDIIRGQENMLTLLFDMNKLWEEYIYRMLIRVKADDITVSFQNSQAFWEQRTIRPDLVITKKGSSETFIIDTKWKVLDTHNPKPSDDDLKQMYAYNLYWNAKRSMLLYPNSSPIEERFGTFWKGRENPQDNQCKVGFVNILNAQGQLNFEIGQEVLDKMIE
ncbi:McrC family protein [Psychroflexus sp. CAK8W]|uniref:McrC family protein n=1 Tax=Psychroflexus longus TaxID=2873596 RepID=A0ABS7XHL5_9FLAO|nr:McrC family protein [Psychroflexus longus]MBZ9778447.1 McrC family protein [Psychroflexus longus]